MNEDEFRELKLRVVICPQQARWPAPNVKIGFSRDKATISGLHWEKLHHAMGEARSVVRRTWAKLDAIDADRNLNAEGKRRKKSRLAAESIAELEEAKALTVAKEITAKHLAKLHDSLALRMKPAANVHVDAKLWDGFKTLSGAARLAWLNKHGSDPAIASALSSAPQECSGLSDSESTFFRKKAETQAAPEIAKERDTTLKALGDAERGWRAAIEQICKRARSGK